MADLISMLSAAAGAAAGGGEVDPYFNQTVLLLHGDGTNGAQNNTFLDSSTNNFTITRNGNTTQGTFSPFSAPDGRWSNYFDGNDYLSIPDSTDFDLDGDFTVQCWINPTSLPTTTGSSPAYPRIFSFGTYNAANSLGLEIDSNNTGAVRKLAVWYNASQYITTANNIVGVGSWFHIGVVRSGTTITVYCNGTSVLTITGASAAVQRSQPFYIASLQSYETDASACFVGYIANFSVLKGTAIDFASTGVPTSPLSTSTTNQKLLTCYGNRFTDFNTATTAKTITRNGDVKVTPFSPFAPTAAYDPAVNGGSGYFDGSGGDLELGTGRIPTTGAFTIEGWVYITGTAANQAIITQYDANAGRFQFIWTESTEEFTISIGASDIITSTNAFSSNQWVNFAIVKDGSNNWTLYINGADNGTASNSTTLSNVATLVGERDVNPLPMEGYVSNVRISNTNRTISATATAPYTSDGNTVILLNFTNAGIYDNTGKNNLETVADAQIDTTTKQFGTGSMEFDGTGDYLVSSESTVFNAGENFTVEAWVYMTDAGTYTARIQKYASVTEIAVFGVQRSTTSYAVFSSATLDGGVAASVNNSTSTFSYATWTHIAWVMNSGTLTFYINGSASGTVSLSGYKSQPLKLVGITEYSAGNNPGFYFPFKGFIDDLRITKGVARTITVPTKAYPDL